MKNIRLNRNKHWATIVFDEPGAVENVIRKKPILLMNAELDIHPYIPIIQGDGWIGNLELHGLPKELTEDLMAKDIERKVGSAEASSAEYLSEDDEEENDGENVEETGNIVAQIKDVTPVKVRMFMATNDDEEVFEKFPNVKMKMNKKTNVINFYGNAAEIQPFKLDVYKKLSTFSVYTFPDISQSSIKLFKSSKVAENINNKLSSNKLECEWETEGTSLIICSCEREIDECCRMVRNSVKEVRFPVCKEAAAVFLSSQWQEDQHALSKKVDFICNMKTMEDTIEVHIVAEHDTIDAVVREIKAFVQQETKRNTEAIKFNKLGPVHETLFDMGLASKLVQKIINDLSMYHVSIERILDDDFYISGTMEGRELVKKRIQNINL